MWRCSSFFDLVIKIAYLITCIGLSQVHAGSLDFSSNLGYKKLSLLGAMSDQAGTLVVLTEEWGKISSGEKKHQSRFLKLDLNGKILKDTPVDISSPLSGYKAVAYQGQLCLGWNESGKGLQIATTKEGSTQIKTVLSQAPENGAEIGNFWFLNVEGQSKLIIRWNRHVDPEGKVPFPNIDESYSWVYCYNIDKDEPQPCGKACIEEGDIGSNEIECASLGKNVIIWQSVSNKANEINAGSKLETIRYAEWNLTDKLNWSDIYSGVSPLSMAVDPLFGSVCLVTEIKGPQNGCGIHCWLGVNTIDLVPVGTFSSFTDSEVCLLRIPSRQSWAIARRSSQGINISIYHDTIVPIETDNIAKQGIGDFALVESFRRLYLVFVYGDTIQVYPCYQSKIQE